MRPFRLLLPFLIALPLFANDANRYIVELSSSAIAPRLNEDAPRLRVRREFSRTFRGAAIELQQGQSIADIEKLPYVIGVYRDEEVRAFESNSPATLNVDQHRVATNANGNGVVVAIIDSGIDRTHPALGSKVIGGWDFVNDDNNPMDDHRHGTHVAGIIAAQSSEMTGVAPGVKLLSYKVLNQEGRGLTSDIIAAIERALDPNNDGNTADRADIANLSLGNARGYPDDPLSRAVDRAVGLGMVVVVAAGNDGLHHMIGSPAGAAQAITVGASYQEENATRIADFSTRGPATQSGAIKPDLVAPGVSILSTGLEHNFIRLSGTSMAAPYVTGLAALLLEQHPDWTPARIKAALVSTASPLSSEEVMTQGSGEVDFDRASTNTVVASPTQLNFGLDGAMSATWSATRRVSLRNDGTSARTLHASVAGTSNAIAISFDPPQLTLQPGETRELAITIAVDHALLGKPTTPSFSFGGVVTLEGNGETVRLPWSFLRAGRATAFFTGTRVNMAWESSEPGYASFAYLAEHAAEVLLEPGDYDFIIAAADANAVRVVVREQQRVEGDVVLMLTDADAPHVVRVAGVDHRGEEFPQANGTSTLHSTFVRLLTPRGGGLLLPSAPGNVFRASSFSERVGLLAIEAFVDAGARTIHIAQHEPVRGLDANVAMTISPSQYAPQEVRLPFAANATRRDVLIRPRDWPRRSYEFSGVPPFVTSSTTTNEWVGTLYMTPETHENYVGAVQLSSLSNRDEQNVSDINTPILRRDAHSFLTHRGFDPHELPVRVMPGEVLEFGRGIVHLLGRITGTTHGLAIDADLLGDRQESRRAQKIASSYRITGENGDEVGKGTLGPAGLFAPLPRAGKYKAEVAVHEYALDGRAGTATLTASFDATSGIAHVPALTSLAIIDAAGRHATSLPKNGNGSLVFSAASHNAGAYRRIVSDATKVFFRRRGTNTWVQLTPVEIGEEDASRQQTEGRDPAGVIYRVDLRDALRVPEGEIELMIEVANEEGNRATVHLAPAFVNEKGPTFGRRRSVR